MFNYIHLVLLYLQVLALSQNVLYTLGGPAQHQDNISLPSLLELDLSDNLLVEIQDGLLARGCPALRRLDLSYNKLTTVPGGLAGDSDAISNLSELVMSGNMIRYLEAGSMAGLGRLSALHLNNMPVLAALSPDALAALPRLEFLTLANSRRLAPVPPGLFQPTPGLRRLDLSQLAWNSLHPDQVGIYHFMACCRL